MVEIIQLYKGEQYKEWTDKVDEDCKFNLSQPLLTRNEESNLISVNFNPKLEAVLREVRYSQYIGENEIPDSAAKLFERHDQLRLWVATLHQTVHWYNKIRKTVLDVEYPLIEKQLGEVDSQLKRAEAELNWSGDNIEYIKSIHATVQDLEERLQKTKDNVDNIKKIMKVWSESPLFDRKIEKEPGLINLADREDRLKKRYALIEESGNKIHALIGENLEFFKADGATPEWDSYRQFVDSMIVEGFFEAIKVGFQAF